LKVIDAVKERCVLLGDFYSQSSYFFNLPAEYDINSVKPKWNEAKNEFFKTLLVMLRNEASIDAVTFEAQFKTLMEEKNLKAGDVMLPFRIMLVGGKFGPHVFDIAALLGKEETIKRVELALTIFNS